MITVGDIVRIIEKIADPYLAESWDNCGIQVGSKDLPVKKIVTALDPLYDVVQYACSVEADLLITHHPLIFKPITQIDFSSSLGKIIELAYKHSLSIYSAHTSFDSAMGGLNDIFAHKIGLTRTSVLRGGLGTQQVKLVVFTPLDHKEAILGALSETTAGIIGNYTCCSFLCAGQGTFTSENAANPYSGRAGETTTVDELRIETVVDETDVARVIKHLRSVHPYETMAYDIYPLSSMSQKDMGLGRVGILDKPMSFKDFAQNIKKCLGLDTIKIVGPNDLLVNTVAVCTGSGSGLLKDFIKSDADVYISGDLSYHDARWVQDAGRGLLDVGHFASEIIMAESFAEKLKKACEDKGLSMDIIVCPLEKDPYIYI